MVWVRVFQNGFLHKGLPQGLENLLLQSAPVKQGLFVKKPSEGCGQGGKARDECPTVVGEPKESLDILNLTWGLPTTQGLNLAQLQGNALRRNAMCQEVDGQLIKLTFLQFGIQLIFPELLQDHAEVLMMTLP